MPPRLEAPTNSQSAKVRHEILARELLTLQLSDEHLQADGVGGRLKRRKEVEVESWEKDLVLQPLSPPLSLLKTVVAD